MARYVIGPDVALRLAREKATVSGEHQLLAPTLFRSQLLSRLYHAVREGTMSKGAADSHLDYVRGLRMRLLGDRVLQSVAWKIADELQRPDTFDAEYLALTRLQADAFITLDKKLASAARKVVEVAQYRTLISGS